VLLLIVGLAAAAGAFAQGAPRAGAMVKDLRGTLTIQTGTGPQQAHKPGTAIPVGAIVRTGAGSSAMLVFSDGQVCALGGNSAVRVAKYAYVPKESSESEMSLVLLRGGLRCVAGEIARSNPAGSRLQVGVVTLRVDPGAQRADALVVAHDGSVAATVERGGVTVFLPTGQPQPVTAGQGLILAPDGTLIRDTAAKIVQHLNALPQGQEMQKQFAALDGVGESMAVTVIMLSTPEAAEKLLAQIEALPPPAEAPAQPLPALATAITPPTGAGGGGLPCGASCN
jgi:hypothetical protein